MKQLLADLARAVVVMLVFVPAPLVVVGAPAAIADTSVQVVAAEPAVIVTPEAEEATEQPWTIRFLAPMALVFGVVTVAAAIAYYVVRIRGRYRVA